MSFGFGVGPAIRSYDDARNRVAVAQAHVRLSLQQLEFTREAYRTALEAHRPAAKKLGKEYDAKQAEYAQAQRDVKTAQAQALALKPAADAEGKRVHERRDARCESPRRVGTAHCNACGAT